MTLQLAIAGTGLTCCAASGHLLSLAGEVTDQFHKGLFQEFVDLSHMAAWSQVRWALRATQTGPRSALPPERRVPDNRFCSEHVDEGDLDSNGPGVLRTRCRLGSLSVCGAERECVEPPPRTSPHCVTLRGGGKRL